VSRFLLVSLNIDAILGEVTITQRKKKLEVMARGNGLSDAYTATLRRLRVQEGNKSVLGLKVLMWVLYSERPLLAEELCHALAVEIGSTDVDPNNVPTLRTLVSSCLGLVTVEASSSTVRLVHFTLKEHLLGNPTLFHSPHSTIAEVCLTYLNFGSVRDLSPTLRSAPSTMPLLNYASLYWGEHTKIGMTGNVKMLALWLLDRFDEHISAQLLLLNDNRCNMPGSYFPTQRGPWGFTGLHGVSFLGIAEIVAALLEVKGWDVNAIDCTGGTALAWAARRGHEEVVKVLLERKDTNPDQAGMYYIWTPLFWAVENGHEGIVKLLLEREDVNPSHVDTYYGRTPLSWAAESGHEGIVKMLLEPEDVNPNHADTCYGRTLLSLAAEKGHEEVVRLLLEREGVDPNTVDTRTGRTPLSWAAFRGHAGVVKILVGRKYVHTATPDNQNKTPLSLALSERHNEVVRILRNHADSQLVAVARHPSLRAPGMRERMRQRRSLRRRPQYQHH